MPPHTPSAPTWKQLRGTLLHRCLLHSARHWLWVGSEDARTAYIDSTVWMAEQLTNALGRPENPMCHALLDTGGGLRGSTVKDFSTKSEDEQAKILDHLVGTTRTAATEIMGCAERDHWTYVLSEVIQPSTFLDDHHSPEARTEARRRLDLVITRQNNPAPLIADLKTSTDAFVAPTKREDQVKELAADHGARFADAWQRNVDTVILAINDKGQTYASPTLTAAFTPTR